MQCIVCESEAISGRKYCQPHQIRADSQPLAEKLAEQRAARDLAEAWHLVRNAQRIVHDADAWHQLDSVLEYIGQAMPVPREA